MEIPYKWKDKRRHAESEAQWYYKNGGQERPHAEVNILDESQFNFIFNIISLESAKTYLKCEI